MAKNIHNIKEQKIDESLYSRQILALGHDVMANLSRSSVLITCCENFSGLGVEVAKCIILSGINKVVIHSNTDHLTYKDLASNYYANKEDIGLPVKKKILKSLASLNNNVHVSLINKLDIESIKEFDCVVFCDYMIHDLFYWNRICRENNIKFIMLQTYGLAGNIFCDFGDMYKINDVDGEPIKTGNIIKIDNNRIITADSHGLYTGDIVQIYDINDKSDEKKTYIVKVDSATSFSLCNYDVTYPHDKLQVFAFKAKPIEFKNQIMQNQIFKQIKMSSIIRFKSLVNALKDPQYVRFDTMNWNMPYILNAFMQALSLWRIGNNSKNDLAPSCNDIWNMYPNSLKDYNNLKIHFINELKFSKNSIEYTDEIKDIFYKLAMTCTGRICAIDTVIGAMGAQEVIKAICNKFTPINQFLHFEALNILPPSYVSQRLGYINIKSTVSDENDERMWQPRGDRYDGQTVIFGRDYDYLIKSHSIFIVGAGAIGSEHIKNFTMMGINKIIITDMDRIENSNLSRQFLFRHDDIGQSKSKIAAIRAKIINPDVDIIAHENKVGPETSNIYNYDFFADISIVANALDNVEARKFVDSLCVKFNKPLLESGTLGTKGSIQSIVPMLTESYSSLQDTVEQSIPLCTLKLFPYKFEHVVQYARDLFEGYFTRIAKNFIKVRNNIKIIDNMVPSELKQIYDDIILLNKGCENFKYCIYVAYKQWHVIFRDPIIELIKKYPADHKDENGILFWSGDKVFPQILKFDAENSLHLDFIIRFAHIWADMIKCIPMNRRYHPDNHDKFKKVIARISEPYVVGSVSIENISDETKSLMIRKINNILDTRKDILKCIDNIIFEKDDDTNNHIDFISTCANIRASIYNIEQKDKLTTKGIAGKIIPALMTTTSIVSGLSVLEAYKVFYATRLLLKTSEDMKLYPVVERFRYGSFNLATLTFGLAEAYPLKKIKLNGKKHSIWTKYPVKPDTRLCDLIGRWENTKVVKENNGIVTSYIASVDSITSDTQVMCSNLIAMEYDCPDFEDAQEAEFTQTPLIDIISEEYQSNIPDIQYLYIELKNIFSDPMDMTDTITLCIKVCVSDTAQIENGLK
jgi:ubiquitin-activating enzyme E1